MIEAKVIEASKSERGDRPPLITLQLRYPRFIHAEFMTHRVFSRNASSSRAVPVSKMLERIKAEPATPVHWGKNQPGMQAWQELDEATAAEAKQVWLAAAEAAVNYAKLMSDMGVHKQIVNRITEPFQHIDVIVTATEWDNFFALRDHPDAQPEIRALAQAMKSAISDATCVTRSTNFHYTDAWHLPYITQEEREIFHDVPLLLAKMSAARCARVSYMTHDGQKPSVEQDLQLFNKLAGSEPMHASPLEHQAYSPSDSCYYIPSNLRNWVQFRKAYEQLQYNTRASSRND